MEIKYVRNLRQILLPDHETWAEIQFLFNEFLSSSIVKNGFFSWFSWHFPYCMLFWGESANCPYGNEENVNREWNVHTKYIGAEIHFLFNKFLSFSFVKNCFFFGFLGIFLISHGFMRIIIPIFTPRTILCKKIVVILWICSALQAALSFSAWEKSVYRELFCIHT